MRGALRRGLSGAAVASCAPRVAFAPLGLAAPVGPCGPFGLWCLRLRGQCLGVLLAEDGVVNFTEVDVHGLLIRVEVDGAVATFMA